jgi:hypothetical protein
MIANNVDIKLLVRSRNRMPSTPAVQLDTNEVLISAWIDIMEPLMCYPHEVKNVPFRYRSGIPFAHAFGIDWYLTETDAEANENPLITDIPQTTIYPSIPYPLGAQILDGHVRLIAPAFVIRMELYGKITIFQE